MFLKGSKKSKEKLEKEEPDLVNYFKTVWDVKEQHEIPSLPEQYLFGLVCCFNRVCPHTVCQSGKEGIHLEWYPGGPKLGYIPSNPQYEWRNKSCNNCKEFYAGHFLPSNEVLTSNLPPELLQK